MNATQEVSSYAVEEIDIFGDYHPKPNTKGMISPVRCNRCGKVYDLTCGKVVHQYSDCTVFITPCCNIQVDDRTWTSSPAITKL